MQGCGDSDIVAYIIIALAWLNGEWVVGETYIQTDRHTYIVHT
jgi:hypothetical protein